MLVLAAPYPKLIDVNVRMVLDGDGFDAVRYLGHGRSHVNEEAVAAHR